MIALTHPSLPVVGYVVNKLLSVLMGIISTGSKNISIWIYYIYYIYIYLYKIYILDITFHSTETELISPITYTVANPIITF